MHPPDDPNCPFQEVILEAIRELEETKLKFSEVTEKVKCCESKLNNVVNVMLKCGTLNGTGLQEHYQFQNRTVETTNPAKNNVTLHELGQKDCLVDISRNIKSEPPELNESEDVSSCHTSCRTPFSSRKRCSIWDSVTADNTEEEPSKRCKSESSEVQDRSNIESFGQKVSTPEHKHGSEIVAGSVVPVVNNCAQDDLSKVPESGPNFLVNKNSELASDCLFRQLTDVICARTLDAVTAIGFTRMTDVQSQVIRPLLSGRNMMVSSRRGSGKTIAFLIPAIEILYRLKFRPCDGTGCVILCLTNELVMQTYGVLIGLMQHHQLTYGMLLQKHTKRSFPSENNVFSQGVNILVSTPHRFLQCLNETSIDVRKLQCLIIDDCDFVLSNNANCVKKVFNLLPSQKQIALFTANEISYSSGVGQVLGPNTSFITVKNKETLLISEGLEHYYVHCEAAKRTFLIFKLLKKWHKSEKVVVIFTKPFYVKYFGSWLPMLGIPVYVINERYGNKEQINTFLSFCSAKRGILLCYSLLSVGLDIPGVSWVVQFDCPSVQHYISGAGMTARGLNGTGKSLILLYPSQKFFLSVLQEQGLSVQEYTSTDMANGTKVFHRKLQVLVSGDMSMKMFAEMAANSCMGAMKYSSHLPQQQSLELAKSFGLEAVPKSGNRENGYPKLKVKTKPSKQNLKKNKKFSKKRQTPKVMPQPFRGTARLSLK